MYFNYEISTFGRYSVKVFLVVPETTKTGWEVLQVTCCTVTAEIAGSMPVPAANLRINYPKTNRFETVGMVLVYGRTLPLESN